MFILQSLLESPQMEFKDKSQRDVLLFIPFFPVWKNPAGSSLMAQQDQLFCYLETASETSKQIHLNKGFKVLSEFPYLLVTLNRARNFSYLWRIT